MSTPTLAVGRPTLIDRVVSRRLVTDIALVAAGAGLTAIAAQIAIGNPVPFTLQTFSVLLVGATLGPVRGAVSMALYLALGVAGLPVYAPQSDGSHVTGLAALALPSFGYIVGFVAASALVGWLAQLEWDRKFLKMLVTFAAGSAVIYAFGVPWLAVALGVDIPTAIGFGVLPFLIGDAIKAVAAAALLPLAWLGVRRLNRDR